MGNFVQDDRSKSQSITMTVGHLRFQESWKRRGISWRQGLGGGEV